MKTLLLTSCILIMVSGSVFAQDEGQDPVHVKKTNAPTQVEIEDKGFIYVNKMQNKIKVRDVGAPSSKTSALVQSSDEIEVAPPSSKVPPPNIEELEDDIDQTISELSGNNEKLEKLKNLDGVKSIDGQGDPISSFMQKMQGTMMTKLLKENPLKMLPKDQMRSTFLSMIDGTPYKKIMENNPKLMNFAMDWLVDDQAIKGFLNIPSNQKQMKNYLYILIGFFIFGFFLNHYLTRDSGLLKKILVKLFMMVFTLGGNLSIFYFMFKKELDPTLDLVKKHFL